MRCCNVPMADATVAVAVVCCLPATGTFVFVPATGTVSLVVPSAQSAAQHIIYLLFAKCQVP